jgi:hypothetical protein
LRHGSGVDLRQVPSPSPALRCTVASQRRAGKQSARRPGASSDQGFGCHRLCDIFGNGPGNCTSGFGVSTNRFRRAVVCITAPFAGLSTLGTVVL